jgi:hypothetical protein
MSKDHKPSRSETLTTRVRPVTRWPPGERFSPRPAGDPSARLYGLGSRSPHGLDPDFPGPTRGLAGKSIWDPEVALARFRFPDSLTLGTGTYAHHLGAVNRAVPHVVP